MALLDKGLRNKELQCICEIEASDNCSCSIKSKGLFTTSIKILMNVVQLKY